METSTSQHPSPMKIFVDDLIQELAEFQSLGTHVDELDPPRTQSGPQGRRQQNPLSGLSASQLTKIKPLLLTLHCLFPNDLLPALDILDRRLVQRLVREDKAVTTPEHNDRLATEHQNTGQAETAYVDKNNSQLEDIFFVISASTAPPQGVPSSTFPTQEQLKGYEVRLHAWACTCPTFTLSAFRDIYSRMDVSAEIPSGSVLRDFGPGCYPFGGTLSCVTDRGSPPVCKHILACILFARCPGLFGGSGDGRRPVSMEELAGWCAGWGG
ncbi:uncharacterized protein N7484_005613 [Penicillium longicatenatum]|uniref:uncharacterized protein n=1 Tax=Penicillium longicatenatum TaxID=1561947 RepID=UPI002548EC76|nr:uncharacterized protein N7484_005613 [Penicillium longicatenatum]KAJ5643106.1 hypothetical protein N7484_005613 [Penicillium longicatenatum]